MLSLKHPIFLAVPLATILLTGCRDTHAHQSPARSFPQPVSSAPISIESAHPSKHAPRSPSLSTYTNPAYGLSFTYPINFDLQEFSAPDCSDDSDSHSLPDQPSALPIATISIPADAYPNTTFSSGSLQLFINPAATPAACRAFSAPTPDSSLSGSLSLPNLTFHWRDTSSHLVQISPDSSTDPDGSEASRLYSAYSHNACYEFLAQLSSAPPLDSDSTARPADFPKIFLHLQKIISSLQLHPAAAPNDSKLSYN